jgi:hypothetical protein
LWHCVDWEALPPDTHTFSSTANGSLRWLDHCIVTTAARPIVTNVSVLYGVYNSDHIPMLIECNVNLINCKMLNNNNLINNKVVWGERDEKQIKKYHDFCNLKLRLIDFPTECSNCANGLCRNTEHYLLLEKMYKNIICILRDGA